MTIRDILMSVILAAWGVVALLYWFDLLYK